MLLYLGVLSALTGIILLIASLIQFAINRSYESNSDQTIATVVTKRTRTMRRGVAFELAVSYHADGNAYEKFVPATLMEYNNAVAGQEIDLIYKRNNPKKAILPAQLDPKLIRILLAVGAGLLFIGVLLYVIGYK